MCVCVCDADFFQMSRLVTVNAWAISSYFVTKFLEMDNNEFRVQLFSFQFNDFVTATDFIVYSFSEGKKRNGCLKSL